MGRIIKSNPSFAGFPAALVFLAAALIIVIVLCLTLFSDISENSVKIDTGRLISAERTADNIRFQHKRHATVFTLDNGHCYYVEDDALDDVLYDRDGLLYSKNNTLTVGYIDNEDFSDARRAVTLRDHYTIYMDLDFTNSAQKHKRTVSWTVFGVLALLAGVYCLLHYKIDAFLLFLEKKWYARVKRKRDEDAKERSSRPRSKSMDKKVTRGNKGKRR